MKAGDTIDDLVSDYARPKEQIEDAIAYFEAA